MFRCVSITILLTSWFTMSSCSVAEWGPHSVCRAWIDYNTLRAPGVFLEQDDHLPYKPTQVGYYRWMYDKDPGHQYACLGTIPPRTCPNCDPVPPGDKPFEYEVFFPAGIPQHGDELWANKLPEPINVPAPAHPDSHQSLSIPSGSAPPTKVPGSPLPPPPDSLQLPPVNSPDDAGHAIVPKKPSRLPSFDLLPPPQPKAIDDNPAPLIGPAAQQGPSLRLTTDQPVSSNSQSAPNPDAVWPR